MPANTAARTRSYRMGKRLEDVEETRRRIVEAAVGLHGTVGPAETTFSAVAATAGVQRSTLYRHFPDDEALFGACTSHWFARHPWPRSDDWQEEPDPARRLERGLLELYRYYDDNTQMLSNAFRDIDVIPTFVGELLQAQLQNAYNVLDEAWPEADDHRRQVAIRLALDLRTWQSLSSNGLRPAQASALMATMIAGLGS